MSVLRKALHEHTFICMMEFVPKPSAQRFESFEQLMQRSPLCGCPKNAPAADRVAGNFDLAPLDAVATFKHPVPALVHFSGKDRERHDLLTQLERMDSAGLEQLLLLSGDRLPGHEPGQRP